MRVIPVCRILGIRPFVTFLDEIVQNLLFQFLPSAPSRRHTFLVVLAEEGLMLVLMVALEVAGVVGDGRPGLGEVVVWRGTVW